MRLFDIVYDQLKDNPIADTLAHKIKGKWKRYGTADTIKIVYQLSQGLIALGIKPGDKIALVSEGRPEWVFVDLACQQVGAILVPLYASLSERDYKIILKEAEVKTIFVSNSTTLKTVTKAAKELDIGSIYTFNKTARGESWLEVLRQGKGGNREALRARMDAIQPEDMCTIIYTSGTSGDPKGVMLSHENIISNVVESSKSSSLTVGRDRALSFLPLNHIYEKTGIYLYLYNAIGIYFVESLDTIADNLREVRPHTFNTVPRLLEKVYDKIVAKGEELNAVKKSLFNWAIALGLQYDPEKKGGTSYQRQLAVANRLIFSKWREALGGNIKQIQCGASALQPRLARVFWAAGIKILEGYGLTETSPVISASSVDNIRIGAVGKILNNLNFKLGDEDEIMVQGPSVMMGYYKNQKLTKEVLDDEGWFKTGDVGKMKDGFLFITDRKKELFKTSGGMYVSPLQIENKLKESKYIDQVMVIGEDEKFPAVLIVPNMDTILKETSRRFLMMDTSELLRKEFFRKIYQEEIDELNTELAQWAKIKEFRIVDSEWTHETGELTPTLKLKRRVIMEKHKERIEDIYGKSSNGMFDGYDSINLEDLDIFELEKIDAL